MDSSNFAPPCRQLTPPFHQIPASCSTVDVRVIDTNTYLYLKPGAFYEPAIPSDGPRVPSYCFLLSHGDRHLVFDLGVRIDWQNYAPQIGRRISARQRHQWVDNRSSDIEAIVWSHNHFDHTGDPSRPDGTVLDSDAVGREIREINFDNTGLWISRFAAFDYFGDGSFYLLDAPGHTAGHMCALARTTAYPPSFVFMGADACHHPGVLRPSQYLPLPRPLPGGDPVGCGGCPGDLLMQLASWKSPNEPFYHLARGQFFPDYAEAIDTVAKIQELDAAGNVVVLLAHDNSLEEHLPLFPQLLNDWLVQGLRDTTIWSFCKEIGHDQWV
ncbi:beta-lactamase domain protein [Aspergillus oryzae]|uniref:Beta-lactamase domain protein n=1 Tax=Aspergillus oryzae TaxID=5062 RepID=A0A1S9DX89_ASPOZ|nr:beta-lactamase domain protein [Aspergillus oryzae]